MNEDELRAKLIGEVKPKGACMNCDLPAVKGKRKCTWHGEAAAKPDVRAAAALERRSQWGGQRVRGSDTCAGCGASDVPDWYRSGSRCKSCTILDRRTSVFGLSTEQQVELQKLSNGQCMICGRKQVKVALSVDHSHYTNEVRGILCGRGGTSCNEIIGFWFDDPKRFLAAAIYLLNCPARKIGIGPPALSEDELIKHLIHMTKEILSG